MSPPNDRSTSLALLLAVALALAPAIGALAPLAGAQNGSPDERDQGNGQANASEERGRQDRGPPEERGPPVDVEDRRGGFATRAPPDSPRPEVAVDASNATARVDRGDVRPLDVHLDEVLAFVDEDGDGAYDVGEPVLDRHPLAERPSQVLRTGTEQREVVYELGEGASMSLVFNVSGERGDRVGAKFDVEIRNYTFDHEGDVHVALGSSIQVTGGLERVERDGRPAVVGEAGEDVAYLSWVQNATVDGSDHPVGSSVLVDAEEQDSAVVYWAYPQGEEIVHDPELGVRDAIRDLAGSLAPFALGLAATGTLLFAGYLVRARWPA
jgi:hypothetical protein